MGEMHRLRIDAAVTALIDRSLAEDRTSHDVTTDTLIAPGLPGAATLIAKSPGVLAGGEVARAVFLRADPNLRAELLIEDGATLQPGDVIARVEGPVGGILRAERCALNFLQHMSGIATETARYAAAVSGTRAAIVDTRKTVPGLRTLQKYAVLVGGGRNHRMDLADGVLIKDNHIAALRAREVGLAEIVRRAKEGAPHTLKVEIEVESMEEAREALEARADVILLDNMPPEEMRRVVEMIGGRAVVEASGGITLESVREVAETGVDIISVGALTHSVNALNISLDLDVTRG